MRQTAAVSMALVDNVSDPLTCPPAKDFANLSSRNSPADFLQRDAGDAGGPDECASLGRAIGCEGLSTLELSVSTQEHIQGLKQSSAEASGATNPPDALVDTASVGT